MKTINDIIQAIENFAPLELQEQWDNSGVQVGYELDGGCSGVVLAVDVCEQALDLAVSSGANMVVTHHPITIAGVKNFTMETSHGKIIRKAIENNITVYSTHTPLDSCSGGLSDHLCEGLGVANTRPLVPNSTYPELGIGRVGELENDISIEEFAGVVKNNLGLSSVRFLNTGGHTVRRVAVCSGSGGGLLDAVKASGADTYICSDLKYHTFQEMAETGIALIEIDHYQSEFCATKILNSLLSEKFANFTPQTLNLNPTKYI